MHSLHIMCQMYEITQVESQNNRLQIKPQTTNTKLQLHKNECVSQVLRQVSCVGVTSQKCILV